MKYLVITDTSGKVKSNAIAKVGQNIDGWEVVAETRTQAEAKEIVKSLGGWITLA